MFKKAFILFLVSMYATGYGQTLKINITGIKNTSGSIRMGFYTTADGFAKEQPTILKKVSKADIANGTLSVTYTDLKSGTYGIALLDDENNNDKMDYGWLMPKEGFGFSNYYHTGLTRPSFDKFSFTLTNETKVIQIKVRYL